VDFFAMAGAITQRILFRVSKMNYQLHPRALPKCLMSGDPPSWIICMWIWRMIANFVNSDLPVNGTIFSCQMWENEQKNKERFLLLVE
jgi:hypothetical protein